MRGVSETPGGVLSHANTARPSRAPAAAASLSASTLLVALTLALPQLESTLSMCRADRTQASVATK